MILKKSELMRLEQCRNIQKSNVAYVEKRCKYCLYICHMNFFDTKEIERRERHNPHGRAFSADRFTAKHLAMLGLFGVHLSTRRAEKKKY